MDIGQLKLAMDDGRAPPNLVWCPSTSSDRSLAATSERLGRFTPLGAESQTRTDALGLRAERKQSRIFLQIRSGHWSGPRMSGDREPAENGVGLLCTFGGGGGDG